MHVADSEVERFHRDGFLPRLSLVEHDVVERLRDLYDRCISGELVPGDDRRMLGDVTRQVMFPSRYHPYFDDNPAVRAACGIAQRLLGFSRPRRCFDMLIDKPPGHPKETPWHQDHAYTRMPYAPAGTGCPLSSLQFWIALDPVSPDNGCMHFVPSLHQKPLLPHLVAGGKETDIGRLLAIVNPAMAMDLSTTVPCPLAPGEATVHAEGTPHQTPPNRTTNRPRRAYIMNIIDECVR